jgi:fatty acid desaturase
MDFPYSFLILIAQRYANLTIWKMETVSFIDYSEKKVSNTISKPARGKALFITPIAVIAIFIAALALITFSFLYFYPAVTITTIILVGLTLKFTLNRERLTFFDEQYAPDVYVEDIEKERNRKYVKSNR